MNWTTNEKEFLRECINNHLSIIETKGNDTSCIIKKKNAWKDIKEAMASAGFDRDVPKLKSQWVRMKVSARKAVASVKRASTATGNSVTIPELTTEDDIVQSMISHEFLEDEILIDSNSLNKPVHIEKPLPEEYLDCEMLDSDENNSSTTPTPKITSSSKLKQLRSLPKSSSKNDIILERQRQIAKESSFSEEINNIKKQKLLAEIEHLNRMNKRQEIQQEEIHSLKIKQLQMQIEHEKEIHALNVELLHKKLHT